MAEIPDRIDLHTHRDLQSWVYNRPIRYAAAARRQGIGSIGDVQWAVLETNGTLSFIKKSDA